MNHTPESYQREWATLTHKTPREVYVPMALRHELEAAPSLEQQVRLFLDDVREGRVTYGQPATVEFSYERERLHHEDKIVVSLARFQSHRARTEAALAEEIIDLLVFNGASRLTIRILPESGTVVLEV